MTSSEIVLFFHDLVMWVLSGLSGCVVGAIVAAALLFITPLGIRFIVGSIMSAGGESIASAVRSIFRRD